MAKGKQDHDRLQLRDTTWPDAATWVWPQEGENGWLKAPRELPVILQILAHKDVNRLELRLTETLIELYSRQMSHGVIVMDDPEAHAERAGFAGTKRSVRSWRERMQRLADLGFIKIAAVGRREMGLVALVHPYVAAFRLHLQKRVPERLWTLFVTEHQRFGGKTPEVSPQLTAVSPPALATPATR